tara:strand:- start:3019 stop:3210 length:192 start_codon:yes stop_codon:yes gene_type:complete
MANKLDNVKVQTTVGSTYDAMIKQLAELKGITVSTMYRQAIEVYCSFKYADELALLQSKNNGS